MRSFVACVVLLAVTLGAPAVALAASLGYPVPSELTEHTTLCRERPAFVSSAGSPTATEQWLYWAMDQNADFCNLSVPQNESVKTAVEAVTTELKAVKTEVAAVKAEDAAIKGKLEGTLKVTCTSGCSGGGGGGGELELTSASKTSIAESDKKAVVFLVGVLMGLVFMGLIWRLVKP